MPSFPHLRQPDAMDCGATCLAMVAIKLCLYSINKPVSFLTCHFNTPYLRSYSAMILSFCARALSFCARALSLCARVL